MTLLRFTASRLGSNSIGGHHDDDGEFVSNTEGIIALCEALKGSAVTSLECAAAPKCLPFRQRALTQKQTLWAGGALEVGDLRLVEDGSQRSGTLGSDVVASETASKG